MRPLILFSLFFIAISCRERQNSLTIKKNVIDHISELEEIKAMIIRNIELLKDSCCQNVANSCDEPDSARNNYFYPATYSLLEKYLPNSDKSALSALQHLSPVDLENSSRNIISSNLSFRYSDSTVIFPITSYTTKDTTIEHLIVYSKSKNIYSQSEDEGLYNQIEIKPNWKYYVIWRIDHAF